MEDARQVAREVAETLDVAGTAPLVAFIDEHGTFWKPRVTHARVFGGQVYVPFDDWIGAVGLLEAALRRERNRELVAVPA